MVVIVDNTAVCSVSLVDSDILQIASINRTSSVGMVLLLGATPSSASVDKSDDDGGGTSTLL